MSIVKYEVLNPTINNKKPFLNKEGLLFFPVKEAYRYYVECAITNEYHGGREYFILLGKEKFDDNCRLCKTDYYGRCQIKLRGEIKNYIMEETKHRGNIYVEYVESTHNYDVFNVY